MSLHINYSYQCYQCSAYYIPFDETVVCPKCGIKEEEVYATFISEAADSASFNLQSGFYEPDFWYINSFADHILHLLFMILEEHRTQKEQKPFEQVAHQAIDEIEFGEQEYLCGHLYQIAIKVKEQLDKYEN